MLQHFRRFAAYNAWANALVYAAAAELSDEEYRRDLGAFFPSVHAKPHTLEPPIRAPRAVAWV